MVGNQAEMSPAPTEMLMNLTANQQHGEMGKGKAPLLGSDGEGIAEGTSQQMSSCGRATLQPAGHGAGASLGSAAPRRAGAHTVIAVAHRSLPGTQRVGSWSEGRSRRSQFPLKPGTFPLSGSPISSYKYTRALTTPFPEHPGDENQEGCSKEGG